MWQSRSCLTIPKLSNYDRLVCFRCDGKGQYRNEFGLMEKCESCQKKDMNFEKINAEPDSNEEGL